MREPPEADVSCCHHCSKCDVRSCHQLRSAHGALGAREPRPARAGRARALRRARVREDHGRGDRQGGRADRADVLPPLRRQARGAVRGRGRIQELLVSAVAACPMPPPPIDAVAAASRPPAPCSRSAVTRPAAPGGHRREPGAAGARADQARVTRLGARRRAAPARRRRSGREPDGRGRDRGVQGRLRALGRRDQRAEPARAHPRFARRAESRDRRR